MVVNWNGVLPKKKNLDSFLISQENLKKSKNIKYL